MAFKPDRPIHGVTTTRTGAIVIGRSRRVKDLGTAIADFIHDSNERCHPFTWTKTADKILEHGQRPRTSFTVHSERGMTSA